MPAAHRPDDRLARIGWRAVEGVEATAEAAIARVVAQHRGGYELHDGLACFTAQPAARFLRRG
ncbi:MAG: hypothetical protein KIS89_13420, partial [Dokdonella sp.]|nr:hypothetical protein [Dokdonella sp.]